MKKKILPRYRLKNAMRSEPFPDGPFVIDYKMYDIAETISLAIMNAPEGCIAISVRYVSKRHRKYVERAARRKGIALLWRPDFRTVEEYNNDEI